MIKLNNCYFRNYSFNCLTTKFLMAQRQQTHCWALSYKQSREELESHMRQTVNLVLQFSRQSSQSSSRLLSDCIEKIRDIYMRTEIVSDFEPIDKFIKKINTDRLKLCDIIQYKCKGYFHWALYIGDGYIIHFLDTEDGGKVLKEKINYSRNNYPCRVNNLSGYAKSKGYQENEYAKVMMAALKDLEVSDFPYDILSNNCGHMVTAWKYGVRFNPEVVFHLQFTVPFVGAVGGGAVGAIIGGVFGYAIEWLPHYCICALIGAGAGAICIGIGMTTGFTLGAFLGYKYAEEVRYKLHKVFMRRIPETESVLAISDTPADSQIEMRGILLTMEDSSDPTSTDNCSTIGKEGTSGLVGNNCELVLYPGNEVMHLVTEGAEIVVKRHDINNTYSCCKGVHHKEVKSLIE